MITRNRLLNGISANLAWAGLCLIALVASSSFASAGSTDPEVAIGEVIVHQRGGGTSVAIKGTWAFDDVLQVEFPLTLVLSTCLLYTSPSPRDLSTSRMPSSA